MNFGFTDSEPYWADVTVDDVPGAVQFYSEMFGWEASDQGAETGHYTVMSYRDKQLCAIGPLFGAHVVPRWMVYFKVRDPHAIAKSVEADGGTVAVPPTSTPDQATIAMFADPLGLLFGVCEADDHRDAHPWNTNGAPDSVTLFTYDTRVVTFYQRVLGWNAMPLPDRSPDEQLSANVTAPPFGSAITLDKHSPRAFSPGWRITFRVSDVDGFAALAEQRGATVELGPRDEDDERRSAHLIDPFGAAFTVTTILPPE